MSPEDATLVEMVAGTKVLCIGDIMLDRYVYGTATRISPEAPVPVVQVKRQSVVPGGVGNVAKNLEAWGVFPLVVSVVGDDANADLLSGFLAGDGSSSLSLIRDKNRPTIVKTRIIAGIQQVVRFDEERILPLEDDPADRLLAIAEQFMGEVGAVAVSDYAKGVMTPRLTRELLAMAQRHTCPVAIDPKGRDYSKYAGAFLVKPNRRELAEASGMEVDTLEQVIAAGRALMRTHAIGNVLVTLSEQGMLLLRSCDDGEKPVILPSKAKEVFDVTGAGDTVLAALAASMAVGASLERGTRLATLAAGVVVGKVGTASASIEEIIQAGRELEPAGGDS